MPRGRAASPISKTGSAAAAGRFQPDGAPAGTPPSVAANITSDKDAGIGAWTEPGNRPRHYQGNRPRRAALKPPMAYGYYAGLTDGDVADLIAYLRKVPPLH